MKRRSFLKFVGFTTLYGALSTPEAKAAIVEELAKPKERRNPFIEAVETNQAARNQIDPILVVRFKEQMMEKYGLSHSVYSVQCYRSRNPFFLKAYQNETEESRSRRTVINLLPMAAVFASCSVYNASTCAWLKNRDGLDSPAPTDIGVRVDITEFRQHFYPYQSLSANVGFDIEDSELL